MTQKCDIAVIGAGPAGLAAAYSAWNSGVKNILLIERDVEAGGILNQCIHNGFGLHRFGQELSGPEYAQKYIEMLRDTGVTLRLGTMVLDISEKRICTVSKDRGYEEIEVKAVILAMGCRERSRGPIFLAGDRGSGVFTAGCAQRYLNIEGYLVGKRVVILGSGDIGLIMARRMTLEGAKVLAVAELMPYSNGLTRNVVQCLEDFDIPLYLSHTVTRVTGNNRVESVEISQVDENKNPIKGTEITFECDTLLLSVGLVPENELSRSAGVELDPRTNGPLVDDRMQTSLEGVFACGNVLHVHDLVDYVSAESERAGVSAAEYVLGEKKEKTLRALKNGDGVAYTVPQRFDGETDKKLEIFFRVRNRIKKGEIRVFAGETQIASFKREFMVPAEMQKIVVPPVLLQKAEGDLTVCAVSTEVD